MSAGAAGPPPAAGEGHPTASLSTEVLGRTWLSSSTFQLDLAPPPGFAFAAGQHVSLCGGGLWRQYTLVSDPRQAPLGICVRRVEQGTLSPFLADCPVGTKLLMQGPAGYFTFRSSSSRPAVFVATGAGIAPFVAMARAGVSGFVLLHGAPSAAELCYREELAAAARRYLPCLSRQADSKGDYAGRVTDFLRQGAPLGPGPFDFYLCGQQEMIAQATLTIDERYDGSSVFSEAFF